MTENNRTTVKVEIVTANISQTIKDCLGRNLKTDPEKQKIFTVQTIEGPFAILITSNANPKIVNLNIFPGLKTKGADLREGVEELQRILPDIYNDAEKIIAQIKDNEGVVKQSLHDFSIKERIIVYEKALLKNSKSDSLKKIAEKAQKQMDTEKTSVPPPKITVKTDPPPVADPEKTIVKETKKSETIEVLPKVLPAEKQEITALVLYNPTATITTKPLEIKIPQETPQPKKKKEKKPENIQEKIEQACKRYNLIELQRIILESLIEKSLSENEIKQNIKTKIKATGDIKGQLLFLKEKKLINQVRGGYKLNFQSDILL